MSCAPGRSGVRCMRHPDPSQRSASRIPPAPAKANPTALQSEGEEHDTPFSVVPNALEGFGVFWIDHALPFHCSASVPFSDPPVAMHSLRAEQDTPPSDANPTPFGFGVVWICQVFPFQPSAMVCTTPEGKCVSPTVVQALDEKHDTAPRKVATDLFGFGVERMRHVLPFQRTSVGNSSPGRQSGAIIICCFSALRTFLARR